MSHMLVLQGAADWVHSGRLLSGVGKLSSYDRAMDLTRIS